MVTLIQVAEFTISKSAKIAECCDKVAQRGTLTRIGEKCAGDYIFMGLIAILALIAVACIALLVFGKYENRRIARLQSIHIPYVADFVPNTSLFDFASLNVVSEPKTVKGKI